MSEPATKKLRPDICERNEEDSPSANAIFLQSLASRDISAEEDPTGNYHDALTKVKKDTEFLEELQGLITSQLEREKAKESRILQKYSPLNAMLDTPLQQKILDCLDEEGLLALKESTMMDLGPDDCLTQIRWEILRKKRQLGLPERFGLSAEEAGVLFGKTAQFARQMEEAARQHYGDKETQSASPSCQWPDQFYKLSFGLSSDDDDDFCYFVRLTLRQKDRRVHAHVYEGFADRHETDINRLLLSFLEFPKRTKFAKKTAKYMDAILWEGDDYHYAAPKVTDEAVDIAKRFCNRLTVTVVAVKPDGDKMELVVSTTGFQQARPLSMHLTPRSPRPQETDFDPTNCVQVQIGEEEDESGPFLRISLESGRLYEDGY